MENFIIDYVKAFIVGDAMGVPYEFSNREKMQNMEKIELVGYGMYNQPKGTWSDDTSMLLATMEGIKNDDVDYEKIMENFVKWKNKAMYTSTNKVFDIGITTQHALSQYEKGEDIATCGQRNEYDNGNGSLMRIAPITFFLRKKYGSHFETNENCYNYIEGLSELTHGHLRSIIACGFYVFIMNEIINNKDNKTKEEIVQSACNKIFKIKGFGISDEIEYFEDYLDISYFKNWQEKDLKSTGYVLDTLNCVIWSFINCNSTYEVISTMIKLGGDTDTIAALSGGLFNLYKKDNGIEEMFEEILNKELAINITQKFQKRMS